MKIMLIGSGGREHALAWKLAQSKKVTTIYVVPGNAGTEMISKCCNVNLFTNENLVNFAKDNHIDLTIVGPENLLVEGIVNLFKQNKLDIIGPSQKAAQLEGNKTYAKQFMERFKIPTAKFKVFSEPHSALAYLENTTTFPVVVKANGLAAGKGVVICKNLKAARETITDFMIDHSLKDAGNSIVMEEFFSGVETSIICITDGKTMVPLVSAQDHKTIHEHGVGLNTGGMGAVCPNPHVNQKVMDDFTKHIMIPTLNGIKQSKLDFHGFLFFGIMITNNGCKCLEYNVRMGDPECQSIVPLMNFDLVALFQTVIKNQLHTFKFLWKKGTAINIVLASNGYPKNYKIGYQINIQHQPLVFFANTIIKENKLLTNGGRVLSVVAVGKSVKDAYVKVYKEIKNINFKRMYFRKDIGLN